MTDTDLDATTAHFPASRSTRILIPLLILIFVLQCAWFIRTQSFTNDEPEDLIAGLEAWHFGEFQQWPGHPPLGRMLFALPLLHTDWRYHLEAIRTGPPRFPCAGGVALSLASCRRSLRSSDVALARATARKLFSETTANFVLALAALSPELVANFSLAVSDGLGCLFIFACVVQWLRYWRNPSWAQAAIFGVLSGLLLLSKYNGPPLLAVLLFLILALAPGAIKWNPAGLQWKRVTAIVLITCLVVWAGYFFHVSKVTFADQMVTIHFAGYTKLLQYEMPTLKTPISIFIPACEWWTGFGWRLAEDMGGHRSFLLGHYSTGSIFYFPVAMLLKWPLLILLLGTAGVYVVLRRKVPGSLDLLLISLIPAIYLLFAMKAPVNIGVRHVLPLYPFLLLYAGAFFEWARTRHWNQRRTALLLGVLVIAQAADIVRYAPDYLSYFTVLVKPANTWRLLSDSNTDWGQGLVALRQFQAAHPTEPIHLAYVGEVDPAWYGIRYTRLHEEDHPTGLVIVSATHLSGQLLTNHYAYRWLLQYPLKTVLNHSLYVFDVPENAPQSAGPSQQP